MLCLYVFRRLLKHDDAREHVSNTDQHAVVVLFIMPQRLGSESDSMSGCVSYKDDFICFELYVMQTGARGVRAPATLLEILKTAFYIRIMNSFRLYTTALSSSPPAVSSNKNRSFRASLANKLM